MGDRITESILRQLNAVMLKDERWAITTVLDETIPTDEVHMHYIDKNLNPRCQVIKLNDADIVEP